MRFAPAIARFIFVGDVAGAVINSDGQVGRVRQWGVAVQPLDLWN
jgi:hypothetical protein